MTISENIEKIRENIARSESRAGRDPGTVRLMAVSKFHPAASIEAAVTAGLRLFGENRVQEAELKFPALIDANPDIELHLIGSLQRNKVAKIIKIAKCVQSVDREELVVEMSNQASLAGIVTDILLEFHTGEDSKAGFKDRDSIYRSIDLLAESHALRCRGFMTMAPFTEDRNAIRKSFRSLVSLQKECERRYPSLDFSVLSMGMSADYEIAIEEGSTLVRVGTAIFGERQ